MSSRILSPMVQEHLGSGFLRDSAMPKLCPRQRARPLETLESFSSPSYTLLEGLELKLLPGLGGPWGALVGD